jgi:hypothetical protein
MARRYDFAGLLSDWVLFGQLLTLIQCEWTKSGNRGLILGE